jgi:hypothetical protein
MYNSDIPTRAELPTSAQLLRSTFIALAAAGVLLSTVVLPAEYGLDPTGFGRALGLTEMGEIKAQLAREAEADRRRDSAEPTSGDVPPPKAPVAPEQRSGLFGRAFAELVISGARAGDTVRFAQAARADETVFTLKPGEGVEYKLTMSKGAKVDYSWTVKDGAVNYDMHGSPSAGGKEKSYKNGRGSTGEQGVLAAEFDGGHGWFWRNRGAKDVTITLQTKGSYAEIKRMI